MATGSFHGVAILQVVREALEAAYGSARSIPSGTYSPGITDADRDGDDARRALSGPRIEASVRTIKPHASTPCQPASVAFWDVTLAVRVVRTVTREHALKTSTRDTLRGQAATDAARIAAALQYPGNYTHTSTGTAATGVVSGRFGFKSGGVGSVELAPEFGRLVTTHEVACVVNEHMWTPVDRLAPDLWLRADLGITRNIDAGITAWTDQTGNQTVTVTDADSAPSTLSAEDNGLGLRSGVVNSGTGPGAGVFPSFTFGDMEPASLSEVVDIILVCADLPGDNTARNVLSKSSDILGTDPGWQFYTQSVSGTSLKTSALVRDSNGGLGISTVTTTVVDGAPTVCRWRLDSDNNLMTTACNGNTSADVISLSGNIANAVNADAFGEMDFTSAGKLTCGELFVKFSADGLTAAELTAYREYINAFYGTSLTAI